MFSFLIKIKHTKNFNDKDKFGNTLLMKSANVGNLCITNIILEKGVHINEKNNYNETAVDKSLKNKHYDVANLLFEHGANFNCDIDIMKEFCNWAILNKKIDTIIKLLRTGTISNEFLNDKIIFTAIENSSNIEVFELFVEHGLDIKVKNDDGDTIIIAIIKKNNMDHFRSILELFIRKGVEIDEMNNKGQTALLTAIYYNNYAVVERLINLGANFKESCALIYAIKYNYNNIAILLINNGININIQYSRMRFCTALLTAINLNNVAIVYALIDKGANLLIKDTSGHDAFYYANMCHNHFIRNKVHGIKSPIDYFKEKNYMQLCRIYSINCTISKTKKESNDEFGNLPSKNLAELCALCYENIPNVTTECNHQYCIDCYFNYYYITAHNKRCGFCRKPITRRIKYCEDN
jgi:ankyrin repeat protein